MFDVKHGVSSIIHEVLNCEYETVTFKELDECEFFEHNGNVFIKSGGDNARDMFGDLECFGPDEVVIPLVVECHVDYHLKKKESGGN